MKRLLLAASILSFGLVACEKGSGYTEPGLVATGAKVKFIHASHNAPSIIFYGKDTTIKFSAAAPTGTILTGTALGSTYPVNGYAAMSAYNDSLKVRVPANSTTSPGFFKDISKLSIEENKVYSVFLIDEFPTLSTLILEDQLRNFNNILDTTYDARFVNAIYGAPAVDVFSKNENAVIFSNVPYKGATEFKNLRRFSASTTDEIQIRLAGTSTIIAKLAFTPSGKRTYTWFARGKNGVTTGTSTQTLTFYTNQ